MIRDKKNAEKIKSNQEQSENELSDTNSVDEMD